MIKKVLFLLLIPTVCFAEGIWGTRYNSFTRQQDYYKNSVSSSSFASTASNADKLDGFNYDYFLSTNTNFSQYLTTTTASQVYLSTITAYSTFLTTGVTQITAGSNITISPTDGKGNVTVTAVVPTGASFWVGTATDTLNMSNYGIRNSSYVYISTGAGMGFFQISDKYIVVSGTTSTDIQNAINYLGNDGGIVELVNSSYTLNSPIKIFKNNVTLRGQGIGTSLVAEPWAYWPTRYHAIYSSGTSGLTLSNFKITFGSNTGQNFDTVFIQKSAYLTISYVWTDNSDRYGLHVEGSNFVFLGFNTGTNCDNEHIYFEGYDYVAGAYSGGYQSIIINNLTKACYNGVNCLYARNVLIANNNIWNCTSWGIQTAQLNYGIAILNNNINYGTNGGGIYIAETAANGFTCSGNTINNCVNAGIQLDGSMSAGSITNNSIGGTASTYPGIYVGANTPASGLVITGNSIANPGNNRGAIDCTAISNSLIANNNATNTTTGKSEWGFRIQAGTGNVIMNNVFSAQDTFDIQIDTPCYNNYVLNNVCQSVNKILNYSPTTKIASAQDGYFGFMRSSPTYTVDVAGTMWVGTSTVSGSSFEQDGSLVFNGNATVYDDLQVDINPASSQYAPSYTSYKAGRLITFSDEAVNPDRIHFQAQMPHSYKSGSEIDIHVHWVGEDATAGNVAWKVDYSTASIAQSFTATTSSTTYAANSATADYHNYTEAASIKGDRGLSGAIIGTLYRDTTDALDTYNGKNVYLLFMDLHFEKDTVGSRQELTK